MTGFWRTDRNVSLYLFHLLTQLIIIATLIHYLCTVALTGLAGWSTFLEQIFKPQLRLWDLWRAPDGRYRLDIHPSVSETSLRPSRLVWAALLGLINTPNSVVLEGITHLQLPIYPYFPPHPTYLPYTCNP